MKVELRDLRIKEDFVREDGTMVLKATFEHNSVEMGRSIESKESSREELLELLRKSFQDNVDAIESKRDKVVDWSL